MNLPPFRSLKLVHGLLGFVALNALVSWAIPALICRGDGPEIALLQWASFLAMLMFSPFFAWVYERTASNQY